MHFVPFPTPRLPEEKRVTPVTSSAFLLYQLAAATLAAFLLLNSRAPAASPGQEYTGVEIRNTPETTTPPPATALPATIAVDTERVIAPLEKKLFGLNYDRYGLETALIDPVTGAIDPEAATLLRGIPLPLNRVAGSDAMCFHWKTAIGPLAERQPQKLWAWAKELKIAVGPIEFEQWLHSVDPKAGTAWAFNINQETVKDHADLVEFLTGTTGRLREGIDWALKRQELGLKEPAQIEIWEIGNEADWNEAHTWTSAEYVEECRRTIAAVRAVNPNAKIAVHALTAPWSPKRREFSTSTWAGWHRNLLKALGPQIDYISFHPYYYGLSSSEVEMYLDRIRDDIHQITGESRIRIYLSEHARWPAMPPSGVWRENWYQTHSLDGCLATAQFLTRCMTRPEIGAASYHVAISSAGPWGVLYRDPTSGKLYSTGIAELLRLFAKLPDGNVVATTVEGPTTDVTKPDLNFVSTAIRTASGLYLVIVNRGPARHVRFALNDSYQLRQGWILTGPNGRSFNTYTNRPLALQPLNATQSEPLTERDIPALSTLVLELQKNP